MKKQKYDLMPTENGKIMRFYLKKPHIDYINELAVKQGKCQSEVLRIIISTYKEISFMVKKDFAN